MKKEKEIIDTIDKAMKEMTSKEATHAAVKELIMFHIKAAAKEIYKNHQYYHVMDQYGYESYIDEHSILSAYPENLIV